MFKVLLEKVRDIGPSEQVGIIELQEDVSLLSEGEFNPMQLYPNIDLVINKTLF